MRLIARVLHPALALSAAAKRKAAAAKKISRMMRCLK
jgi:hypothetical protein